MEDGFKIKTFRNRLRRLTARKIKKWRKGLSTLLNLEPFMTDAQERASDRSRPRPHMHHHPFFIIPAYDDAMQRLIFVSNRTGTPQVFAEERATGELRQLTDRPDLGEWSVHPSHNGAGGLFHRRHKGVATRLGDA